MDATSTPEAKPQPEGRRSEDGKLLLFGYKDPPPQPLAPPRIADLKPMVLTLEPGRYSWCSCGYSARQPFCDNSHRAEEHATNRKSFKFEVLEQATVAFCMCRHTGNAPYCDGTCRSLAAAVQAAGSPLPAEINGRAAAATAAMAGTTAAAGAEANAGARSAAESGRPAGAPEAPLPTASAVAPPPERRAALQDFAGLLGPVAGVLLLLGRICFAYMFILSGWGHATGYDRTLSSVGENMPFIPLALQPLFAWGAAFLLLGGGLMVLLGFGARIGALLIIVFLIPTLLFWHDYWNMPEEEVRRQMIQFQKNLAMIGGGLYIMTLGAGPLSLDALLRRRR